MHRRIVGVRMGMGSLVRAGVGVGVIVVQGLVRMHPPIGGGGPLQAPTEQGGSQGGADASDRNQSRELTQLQGSRRVARAVGRGKAPRAAPRYNNAAVAKGPRRRRIAG